MRILSLHPATTELLFAIGAGGNVIGRTDACDWPEHATKAPSIGLASDVTPDKVMVFQPDLVLTGHGQEELAGLLMASCKVARFTPRSLEGIRAGIRSLAELTANTIEADVILHELDALLERAALKTARFHAVRVYLEAPGAEYNQELLKAVGGEPFIGEPAPDAIAAFDPHTILLCDPAGTLTPEVACARDGWKDLRAVTHERVFQIESWMLHRPGPRLLDGVKELAKILHGVTLDEN